jgi:4-alpha-glucanotransferase
VVVRQRLSGVLLHPTSLPGPSGVGDLGQEAHRFVEFLADAGQGLWQVLPLGPTGYGDSPYQCFSAFAGNPLLLSLDTLVEDGLLSAADVTGSPAFPLDEVDYGAVIEFKFPLLDKAFQAFEASAPASAREDFRAFCSAQASWLDDYALFVTVKEAHEGVVWTQWEKSIAAREPAAVARWTSEHAHVIASRKFRQYEFFRQWAALRKECRARGVRIMGDVPIFVAHDSADVWAHRELFRLDVTGEPEFVAGVPPDYFSETGQLWGNPLYRWDVLAKSGYRWWIERLRAALALVDLVRLDHFRGFEAYWEIPGKQTTAIKGRWVKGPGAPLFEALRDALGELPIVAENLGVITPEVEALRARFELPGMAILQFAFGTDPQGPGFRPHNYDHDLVVYTGTHDNDTTVGWWTGGVGDSTRVPEEVEQERALAGKYLATDGADVHWAFIRAILASVADVAITPLQDVLGLGSQARMNVPGRPAGNWRWRFRSDALTDAIRERLRELTELYGRLPPALVAEKHK